MQWIKDNIYLVLALAIAIIIVVIIVIKSNRRNSLRNKINTMGQNNTVSNIPTLPTSINTPPMYGSQPVAFLNGEWRLKPGTCELFETGIVDWNRIEAMSDSQKEILEAHIDNCRGENIPLLQPA